MPGSDVEQTWTCNVSRRPDRPGPPPPFPQPPQFRASAQSWPSLALMRPDLGLHGAEHMWLSPGDKNTGLALIPPRLCRDLIDFLTPDNAHKNIYIDQLSCPMELVAEFFPAWFWTSLHQYRPLSSFFFLVFTPPYIPERAEMHIEIHLRSGSNLWKNLCRSY